MTFSSARFWEERYASGGNSGDGSYGESAQFKARFLNEFVAQHGIRTVVEFGCGDGNQLSLAEYPAYIGYDVSEAAGQMCVERFAGDATKQFWRYVATPPLVPDPPGDLSLSLDVIYHLVEDDVYQQHLTDVFAASSRYAILYTTDSAVTSNEGTAAHVLHRPVMADVAERFPRWESVLAVKGLGGCAFLVYRLGGSA